MNLTPTEYINLNPDLPPEIRAMLLDLEQATVTIEELNDSIDELSEKIAQLQHDLKLQDLAIKAEQGYSAEWLKERDDARAELDSLRRAVEDPAT